jgi:hypothetical protein
MFYGLVVTCFLNEKVESRTWARDLSGRDRDEIRDLESRDRDETETITNISRRDRDETMDASRDVSRPRRLETETPRSRAHPYQKSDG